MSAYYADIAVPGTEDKRLVAGPVDRPGLLLRALFLGSQQLREHRVLDLDDPLPLWHGFAEEEGGERRPLTTAEKVAIVAEIEQACAAMAEIVPADEEPD